MQGEEVNSLDEAKLLGYFESIKSVFLLKLVLLSGVLKERNGTRSIDVSKISQSALDSVRAQIDDPLFYKALARGNPELCSNYVDDTITSLLSSSWIVFEQIIKDLTKTDYATHPGELSACYQSGRFRFDKREKKDIELFYYIRNATQHYNGAYNAAKDIDHQYAGTVFKSVGHHGEKIVVSPALAWQIACDLERYTAKAWGNAKTFVAGQP